MPASAFISYSRWNKPFADRLYIDLERAGVKVWMDTTDILAGRVWRKEIQDGINRAEKFLLLVSPESIKSVNVKKEVNFAKKLGKAPVPILVGGTATTLPRSWTNIQMIDFTQKQYWLAIPELFRQVFPNLTSPDGFEHFLDQRGVTVAAAATALRGARTIRVGRKTFAAVPIGPTGYTTTWLIGPTDVPFVHLDDLAWLLHFSGPIDRPVEQDVLKHLTAERCPVWVVSVEGPKNHATKYFEMPHQHIWKDAIDACAAATNRFVNGRNIRLFANCPVQLGFAVGGRAREMFRSYRLYHYTAGAGTSGRPYDVVYQSNRM